MGCDSCVNFFRMSHYCLEGAGNFFCKVSIKENYLFFRISTASHQKFRHWCTNVQQRVEFVSNRTGQQCTMCTARSPYIRYKMKATFTNSRHTVYNVESVPFMCIGQCGMRTPCIIVTQQLQVESMIHYCYSISLHGAHL